MAVRLPIIFIFRSPLSLSVSLSLILFLSFSFLPSYEIIWDRINKLILHHHRQAPSAACVEILVSLVNFSPVRFAGSDLSTGMLSMSAFLLVVLLVFYSLRWSIFFRYCSNLYPKAESYEICNWCMSRKEDKEKSHNSSNSSSNKKTNSEDSNHKRRNTQKSPERSPSTRRRIITNGALEEKLRRTRSKEVSNRVIAKPVYRNKVRRYKLLDEVSS